MAKSIVETQAAPAPIGPYSQAVQVGDTVYISGQIALHPDTGELETADLQQETHRVMKNLGAILAAAGLSYHHVVKCSIFLSDMNNFGTVNEVYGQYFTSQPPARETVEVSVLPKQVNVEISAIAVATA